MNRNLLADRDRRHRSAVMSMRTSAAQQRDETRGGRRHRASRIAIIVAMAGGALLPASAGAWQAARVSAISAPTCSAPTSITGAYNRYRGMPNGWARISECLAYYRSASGIYTYRAELHLEYHAYYPGATDNFAGSSSSTHDGTVAATLNCGHLVWHDGEVGICASPTAATGRRGTKLDAVGSLIDPYGTHYAIRSPVVITR